MSPPQPSPTIHHRHNNQLKLHQYEHRNNKLPLAILLHYNIYYSIIYAILIGQVSFRKHTNYHYCNRFQRDLLLPVYFTWLLSELLRLHIGNTGVLRDKLPEVAAFLLLTLFPQVFTVMYLGYLQEIIISPVDGVLGSIMMAFVILEIGLAWRFLRGLIGRQTALFYRDNLCNKIDSVNETNDSDAVGVEGKDYGNNVDDESVRRL